jgi:hypothetical protein
VEEEVEEEGTMVGIEWWVAEEEYPRRAIVVVEEVARM